MSTWKPWNNTTMDARENASNASNARANKAADAATSATGEMRAVRDAATGTGDWPPAKPMLPKSSIEKEQV